MKSQRKPSVADISFIILYYSAGHRKPSCDPQMVEHRCSRVYLRAFLDRSFEYLIYFLIDIDEPRILLFLYRFSQFRPALYQRRFIREIDENSTNTNTNASITHPKQNSTKLLRHNLCDGNS